MYLIDVSLGQTVALLSSPLKHSPQPVVQLIVLPHVVLEGNSWR